MEKYIREDGKVAVLVSHGYGCGWSTWNPNPEYFAMDHALVEMKLKGASEEEVDRYLHDKFDYACVVGWDDIEIKWLEPGTVFSITDHDGAESLNIVCYGDYMSA